MVRQVHRRRAMRAPAFGGGCRAEAAVSRVALREPVSPRRRSRPGHRPGITLLELVGATAVIGTMLGLSLSVLSFSIERSRRISCQNNLRQIGLGVLAAEVARNGMFPAAFTYDEASPPVPRAPASLSSCRRTWVVDVLPFLDEAQVHDAFDPARSLLDPRHAEARAAQIAVLLCPSDPHATESFRGVGGILGSELSRCTYGSNGGLGVAAPAPVLDAFLAPFAAGGPDAPWWKRYPGIMGGNVGVSSRAISDPLSKTILIAELRAGEIPIDPRGVWSLPAGSSSVWAYGGRLGIGGPNSVHPAGDDVINCTEMMASIAPAAGSDQAETRQLTVPCNQRDAPGWVQIARSMHEGGLYVCMADGSVRWIGDFIQVDPSYDGSLSVWDRLIVSNDGQIIGNRDY